MNTLPQQANSDLRHALAARRLDRFSRLIEMDTPDIVLRNEWRLVRDALRGEGDRLTLQTAILPEPHASYPRAFHTTTRFAVDGGL